MFQLFGDHRLENCHGQNEIVSGPLDIIKATDLPTAKW
jgi:hypothetical protein